jgi:hypothetical protein
MKFWGPLIFKFLKQILVMDVMKCEIPEKAGEDGEIRRKFLRDLFGEKGYIRVRIRKSGGKRKKVRNLRLVYRDAVFVREIQELLKLEGINSLIYPIGEHHFCLDIEGKHKLEVFLEKIGFSEEEKIKEMEEAIKPLSISGG